MTYFVNLMYLNFTVVNASEFFSVRAVVSHIGLVQKLEDYKKRFLEESTETARERPEKVRKNLRK